MFTQSPGENIFGLNNTRITPHLGYKCLLLLNRDNLRHEIPPIYAELLAQKSNFDLLAYFVLHIKSNCADTNRVNTDDLFHAALKTYRTPKKFPTTCRCLYR